jgi:hypothetical protein
VSDIVFCLFQSSSGHIWSGYAWITENNTPLTNRLLFPGCIALFNVPDELMIPRLPEGFTLPFAG